MASCDTEIPYAITLQHGNAKHIDSPVVSPALVFNIKVLAKSREDRDMVHAYKTSS